MISVIVPIYNAEKYLHRCIKRILAQDYTDYELLLIDDGSTDNSLEEIKKFDVKFYTTNRLQAGGARNLGIKKAKGEYIIFLDSDDYLSNNNILEELNNFINNEDLIFLNYTMNKDGEISNKLDVSGDVYKKIELSSFLGAPTKCYKRSLIKDLKFPERQRFEDIVFTLEAMCKANSYNHFNNSFFIYRKVEDSNYSAKMSIDTITSILNELLKLYQLCYKYPKYKDSLMNRLKRDKLDKRISIMNYMLDNNIEFLEGNEFYKLINEK